MPRPEFRSLTEYREYPLPDMRRRAEEFSTEMQRRRTVRQISPRPVLLIHGEQDPYVPRSEIQALYKAAGNPKALWIVPGAGHRQADQTSPEEYWARVLGFFDHWLARGE